MTTPRQSDPGSEPPVLPAAPTVRAVRPPVPGRAGRGEPPTGAPSGPRGTLPDEATDALPGSAPVLRQRTIRFGTPAPVTVTVGPRTRPRPRRRHRTWPWIAAVVLALVVLGVVLLVMVLQGATIDPDTDVVGSAGPLGTSATPVDP